LKIDAGGQDRIADLNSIRAAARKPLVTTQYYRVALIVIGTSAVRLRRSGSILPGAESNNSD
jgi:hypothetical protein